MNNDDLTILKDKANHGFVVCFNRECYRREHCLRWLAKDYVPQNTFVQKSVNLASEAVQGEDCPMFLKDQKVKMGKGMIHLFEDMPRKMGDTVKALLIKEYKRTYFYEYRNGTRLITPSMQEYIANVCKENGWDKPVTYDEYVEDYEW